MALNPARTAHRLILAIRLAYLDDDDVICSTWSANTAYPAYDKCGWHPDYPYWWIKQPRPLKRSAGRRSGCLTTSLKQTAGPALCPAAIFLTQEDMLAQLPKVENPSEMICQLMGGARHQPSIIGG